MRIHLLAAHLLSPVCILLYKTRLVCSSLFLLLSNLPHGSSRVKVTAVEYLPWAVPPLLSLSANCHLSLLLSVGAFPLGYHTFAVYGICCLLGTSALVIFLKISLSFCLLNVGCITCVLSLICALVLAYLDQRAERILHKEQGKTGKSKWKKSGVLRNCGLL
jgi:hypothetical protein